MVQLTVQPQITYGATPGFALFSRTPYNKDFVAYLKRFPGPRWSDPRHGWLLPEELVPVVVEYVQKRFGWRPTVQGRSALRELAFNPRLYPYEKEDVARVLSLRRVILALEMGCGKTVEALEACRLSGSQKVLVVVPGGVRSVWEDAWDEWWPGGSPLYVMRDGKTAARFWEEHGQDARWGVVTSYDLLPKLRILPEKIDFIVFDESHYLKEVKPIRSRTASALLDGVRDDAYRLLLTGTPITIEPRDLWHQTHLVYPYRLGTQYRFEEVYCGRMENRHATRGYTVKGVNPARADELFSRLKDFVIRRTKDEPDVAKHLPPLIVQTIRLAPSRTTLGAIRKLLEEDGGEEALIEAGKEKLDEIVGLVRDSLEEGCTHIGVITYYRDTGRRLRDALGELDVPVYYVDGSLPEKKRAEIINAARAEPRAILVGTMMSVNVGINLTRFSPSYVTELYSAAGIMSQLVGRFHRVGGESKTAIVRFVVHDGTGEEKIAYTLERRIKEHGKVLEKGRIEHAVLGALEDDETAEARINRLRKAFRAAKEEDAYGAA